MNQTTIVTAPVMSDLNAWPRFSSMSDGYRGEYPAFTRTEESVRNGLWATAVWGTKGLLDPDIPFDVPDQADYGRAWHRPCPAVPQPVLSRSTYGYMWRN